MSTHLHHGWGTESLCGVCRPEGRWLSAKGYECGLTDEWLWVCQVNEREERGWLHDALYAQILDGSKSQGHSINGLSIFKWTGVLMFASYSIKIKVSELCLQLPCFRSWATWSSLEKASAKSSSTAPYSGCSGQGMITNIPVHINEPDDCEPISRLPQPLVDPPRPPFQICISIILT